MPTPRQEKLINLVKENLGKTGNTKSLGELMLEAGYSEVMSRNPYQVFETETMQEGLQDFKQLLDDKRRLAITHITKDKIAKSSPRDLAYVADVFTKNHQLLSGGVTENLRVSGVEISVRKNADTKES